MPSEDESSSGGILPQISIEDCDDQTIRIMVSSDNHLGYLEDDPIRGDDSFAALEEVMYLARTYGCDMVLLAGDLFHHNKPSRLTMFKAMNIFRRYCMGKNPVSIQILSDQKENFRRGVVNYQDEFYSVDLPVMSIHGNHDSPVSEGAQGSSLLAALDLMDAANLINYIGRQENNKDVEVSPVLIKKGRTRIALYGLGSMREERLNRLWQTSKFTFLRPSVAKEVDDDGPQWFNLFALHQNRDKGRGSKNCVHEFMVPEWMDLVIWGHEHESLIEPQESVVGTFRVLQPGSSVATSLVTGESVRKQIGLLDIRGTNFRLRPISLTQVRTFAVGEVSLVEYQGLDPDDPKVEQKVKQVLKEEVELLIHQAKQKARDLLIEARNSGNTVAGATNYPLQFQLRKPQEVLVRLKVEHTGFSVVNNQRFGAGFVGDVANTSDILLFQRKKAQPDRSSKRKATRASDPVVPEAIEEMNIEDFIVGELDADNHLDIFDESRMASALDEYVSKEQAQAINDSVNKLLLKQQSKLIKQGPVQHNEIEVADESEEPAKTKKYVKKRSRGDSFDVEDMANDEVHATTVSMPPKPSRDWNARSASVPIDINSHVDDAEDASHNESKSEKTRKARAGRGQASSEEVHDFLQEEVIPTKRAPIFRRGRSSIKRTNYMEDDSDIGSSALGQPAPSRKDLSQSQLSFIPILRQGKTSSAKPKRAAQVMDSEDEEHLDGPDTSDDFDEDWGAAKTDTIE